MVLSYVWGTLLMASPSNMPTLCSTLGKAHRWEGWTRVSASWANFVQLYLDGCCWLLGKNPKKIYCIVASLWSLTTQTGANSVSFFFWDLGNQCPPFCAFTGNASETMWIASLHYSMLLWSLWLWRLKHLHKSDMCVTYFHEDGVSCQVQRIVIFPSWSWLV
jgi:hypothetical protein